MQADCDRLPFALTLIATDCDRWPCALTQVKLEVPLMTSLMTSDCPSHQVKLEVPLMTSLMTSDCPSHQVELEETMHAQIGRVVAAKGREGDRLQREIDRLKAVHDLALREGMPG